VTRALVLGGGGPVGVAWEAGLLVGLGRGGVAVAEADAVIGTSAGAVVGCLLASGGDLTQVTSLVAAAFGAEHSQLAAQAAGPLDRLISVLAQSALRPQEAAGLWARLGSEAAAAQSMSEGGWLEIFQTFAGVDWPPGFACTAVGADDGCYQVWDQSCGIDVQHARLAASIAARKVTPARQLMCYGRSDLAERPGGPPLEAGRLAACVSCPVRWTIVPGCYIRAAVLYQGCRLSPTQALWSL